MRESAALLFLSLVSGNPDVPGVARAGREDGADLGKQACGWNVSANSPAAMKPESEARRSKSYDPLPGYGAAEA